MLRKLLAATPAAAPLLVCAAAALAEVEITSRSRTTPISTSSPNGGAADDVKVTADRVDTLKASGAVADTLWNTGSIAAYVVATDDDDDLDDDNDDATDEVGSQQITVTMSRLRSKSSHVESG